MAFAQGMLGNEAFELADQLCVAAQLKIGVETGL